MTDEQKCSLIEEYNTTSRLLCAALDADIKALTPCSGGFRRNPATTIGVENASAVHDAVRRKVYALINQPFPDAPAP